MPLPELQHLKTASGQYLSFVTDSGVSNDLKQHGSYAPALHKLAIQIHRLGGGEGVLVDVGAHIGTFSIPVALATGCAVYAFEAQRLISQLLNANFILNRIEQAYVENVALGGPGHPAGIMMPEVDYSQPGNFGAVTLESHLFDHAGGKMYRSGFGEIVRMATLDSFDIDGVFLIKVDVEGAELAVLKGAVETLRRNDFPPLIFEAWDQEWWVSKRADLFAFLRDLGYVIAPMGDDHLAQHQTRVLDLDL
jgi:FkbM family methyltransferase